MNTKMEGADGLEIIRQLRANPSARVISVLTISILSFKGKEYLYILFHLSEENHKNGIAKNEDKTLPMQLFVFDSGCNIIQKRRLIYCK